MEGRDYSIFNLIMSTASFKDCDTHMDAVRYMYDCLHPYLDKQVKDNIKLRHIIYSSDKKKDPQFQEIIKMKSDIFKGAKDLLEKGRDQYLGQKHYGITNADGDIKVE